MLKFMNYMHHPDVTVSGTADRRYQLTFKSILWLVDHKWWSSKNAFLCYTNCVVHNVYTTLSLSHWLTKPPGGAYLSRYGHNSGDSKIW